MTLTGVIVTLVSYDGLGCYVTLVSYDGTGVIVTLVSYDDSMGCHGTPPPAL